MRYWIDTEFIERGRKHPLDLISIGIVAEDGRELYLQNASCDFAEANDWVWKNVYPHLIHFDQRRMKRSCRGVAPGSNFRCAEEDCVWSTVDFADLQSQLLEFCSPEQYGKPEFWGYYADYDWVVLCQIFGTMMDLPKGWPMYCRDLKQWCDQLGNPKLPPEGKDEHHALADARWNKAAWEFLERRRVELEVGIRSIDA